MNSKFEIIDDIRYTVAEGPLWDERTETLYALDFREGFIRAFNFESGNSRSFDAGMDVSALALLPGGEIMAAAGKGLYRLSEDGVFSPVCIPGKLKGRRFNDGKVGPDGRYYIGTKSADHEAALYRYNKNGEFTEILPHVGSSNGLEWSLDGKYFYYCDSPDKKLYRFDFDKTEGTLSNRTAVIEVPQGKGEFDGMTIDAEGMLWCAVWDSGRVYRIDPVKGTVADYIELPVSKVSSCAFAGPELDTLVVTTASIRTDLTAEPLAGKVFACKPGVHGRAAFRFGAET